LQEYALNSNRKTGIFFEPQSYEKSAVSRMRIGKCSQNSIGNAHTVLSNLQIKIQG